MNMKKTLALLLAAGMLSASLASCVVKGDDPDNTSGKTEPPYTQGTIPPGSNPGGPISTDPSQVIYTAVNETVYVIEETAVLKSVAAPADAAQSISLAMLSELTRTGKHNTWSKVSYNGAEYYIASSAITDDDIFEKNFVECNKTMYVNVNTLNVRKYPSAPANSSNNTNYFSTILASISLDTEVKVISQGTSWSKVQVKVNDNTITGFVNSSFLSTTKASATEKEYLQYFTAKDPAVLMYTTEPTTNLRQHPYSDNRGTLMPGVPSGLPQGTEVTVIGEGTVEGHAWYMISWTEAAGAAPRKGYISADCLNITPAGTKATLEDMLAAYPDLVKFDNKMTLYTTGSVRGRSRPCVVKPDNPDGKETYIVKSLDEKAIQVTAVAYGTLETINEDGVSKFNMAWVLIEDQTDGYYLVSYRYLTPNATGEPAQLPLSLEQMMELYSFTALNATIKTTQLIKAYTTPSSEKAAKDIPADTALTVKAKGETGDQFLKVNWYIVEYDGALYFIVNDSNNFNHV